ncbi:MAG: hypothetical protein HY954_08440 [Deltaproteobacteria bacterium]|nr:hypothetical protein [Deltaproteobacteria bacterium]
MLSSLGFALSGIKAALKMLDTSAHNTANANTDGYQKQKAELNEQDNGGVIVTLTSTSASGAKQTDANGAAVEASTTDYAEEAAAQISAKHLLGANAAALKTEDEMQKSIIDIFA